MDLSESGRESATASGVLARTPGPILLASLIGAETALIAAQLSVPNRQKAEDIALMIDEKDVLSLLEGTGDTWRDEGFAIFDRVLQQEIATVHVADLIKLALDRCSDELAAAAGRVRDNRSAPRSWTMTPVIEKVSARTRSLMIETLFPVSPWQCPDRVSILLNNQPDAKTLRVSVDVEGQEEIRLNAWRQLFQMFSDDVDCLEGPISGIIGPSPSGALDRLMLARANPKQSHYWIDSAANWLATSIDVYLAGGPGRMEVTPEGRRWWHYASRNRKAFSHALRCLSGPGIGQIATQFCLSGPIIPTERAFSILVHPGSEDVEGLTFPESLSSMGAGGAKAFI